MMILFLERLSTSNMLSCAEQVQVQNIKYMQIRHPKQSCSNIKLSSKDGLKRKKKKRSVNSKRSVKAEPFRYIRASPQENGAGVRTTEGLQAKQYRTQQPETEGRNGAFPATAKEKIHCSS